MSETTVLEMLECAKINFENVGKMGLGAGNPIFLLATMQLDKGIQALVDGLRPDDIIHEEDEEP